jgi:hypothetical protein
MLADAGFFFTGICILNIKKQPLFELSSNIFKGSVTIEHCTWQSEIGTNKTSLTLPLLLKFLYQVMNMSGHVFVC